jgi:hypothetical protein
MLGLAATTSQGSLPATPLGKLGHHFHFDIWMPFQTRHDQFIMLTGRNTIDNPIAINPVIGLTIQLAIQKPT